MYLMLIISIVTNVSHKFKWRDFEKELAQGKKTQAIYIRVNTKHIKCFKNVNCQNMTF